MRFGVTMFATDLSMDVVDLAREAEARGFDPWRMETTRAVSEKMAAVAEGVVAAQLSLARSTSTFWLEFYSGSTPSLLNGVAIERAMHAALKPAGRRVKKNYRRLKNGG